MTAPIPLYLEDLRIGMRFATAPYALDQQQIVAFARQFDPQPFHTDPDAAKASFFQGLVASGWHVAAVTMRLLVDTVPLAGGLIGAGGTCDWPRPARVGDTLRVEAEIVAIHPSQSRPDRGIITVKIDTLNQNNEAVQNLVAKMVVFRGGERKEL